MIGKIFALLLLTLAIQSAKLPSNWKKCPKRDNVECLKEAIRGAIVDLKNGNKELGVIPLDPLRFERLELNQGQATDSPIYLNLTFTNLDVIGASRIKVTKVKFDWEKLDIGCDIIFENGPLILEGDYTSSGKVILVPVRGIGKSKISLHGFSAWIGFKGSEKVKNKKKYFNIEKSEFIVRTNKADMYFGNVFDGNKQLSDNINKFFNENWQEVISELNGTISQALNLGLKGVAQSFFDRVPITQLYS